MVKQKYVVVAGVTLGVLVLFGGGFGLWQHSHAKKANSSLSLLQGDDYTLPASSQSSGAGSGNGPLASSNARSGLNVATGSAASQLGQITPSQNTNGGATGAGAGAGSGSSSSPSPVDPTTFAQYDKYKESQSGLFGDMQVGTGAELTAGKKAAVYYKGWLTNGQLFDQSRAGSDGKIQPFAFTLGEHQVIIGWEQALAGMKVGGTRLVIVPPAVGYGASGQGSIPGNAVLVFQVELAAVQ